MQEPIKIVHALLLLLLPLPCLVILKPIENVLPFYMPISSKPTCYLLYLLGARRSNPLLVQPLQKAYLLLGGVPPRARWCPTSRWNGHADALLLVHGYGIFSFCKLGSVWDLIDYMKRSWLGEGMGPAFVLFVKRVIFIVVWFCFGVRKSQT